MPPVVTHMHPILTIFSLIAASYMTPFTFSQNIYNTYIFFISIVFIRLYSNNAFKVSDIISRDTIDAGTSNMKNIGIYEECRKEKNE